MAEIPSSGGQLQIALDNNSTVIQPRIGVYDVKKKWVGGSNRWASDVTKARDVKYAWDAQGNSGR